MCGVIPCTVGVKALFSLSRSRRTGGERTVSEHPSGASLRERYESHYDMTRSHADGYVLHIVVS